MGLSIRYFRPRFSILTLLILTALVAVVLSHIQTSRELSRVRQNLTTARNELSYIDADDGSKIYAVALPTFGPTQWRWRIQLPATGKYRIRSSFSSKIPESGWPVESTFHDHAFLDSRGQPLPGGEPFILTVAVHKNESQQWVTTIQTPDRSETRRIENAPQWLEAGSFIGWTYNVYGNNGTVSAAAADPLPILIYRKGKTVPGGTTVEMQPTDGMLFWIERINDP